MRIIDFVLEKDIEESRILGSEIFRCTEPGIHICQSIVGHESDILRIVFAYRHTYFYIRVQLPVGDVRAPRRTRGQCICTVVISVLTTLSLILEGTHSEPYLDSALAIIQPTVCNIELKHFRVVAETVVIVVGGLEISGNMSEQDGAPFLAHLQG